MCSGCGVVPGRVQGGLVSGVRVMVVGGLAA